MFIGSINSVIKLSNSGVLDVMEIHKTVLRIKTNANGHDEVNTKMFVIYSPH